MPVKKTEAQKFRDCKYKVLDKLYDSGCMKEKDLQSLGLSEMLKIPNITVQELSIITELQKSAKANTVFSYLGGGEIERQHKHENP